MRINKFICDIQGCENETDDWVMIKTTVINVEDQRMDLDQLDLCEDCQQKIIHNYGSILKGIKDDEYVYKIHIRNRLDDKGGNRKVSS